MVEQFVISIQIILIDIVMAADNAIIIGLIASGFAPQNRRKIIGGLLLLWIVNNIRQDLFASKRIRSPEIKSKESVSFGRGVYRVLVADIVLSFDNVLGVVGAAKDYYYLMITGLLLSVFLVATLASFFANYIKENKWLGYVGLFVIIIVAIQLIVGGFVNYGILSINESYEFLFTI